MSEVTSKSRDVSAFAAHAPELADVISQVTSDIALVLDGDGLIRNVVLGGSDIESLRLASGDWVGRLLADTVTTDTRKKVDELLRDVSMNGVSRLRHLSHPNPAGADIPFAYTVLRLGSQGPLLAIGRDLRTVVAMQQRFVSTQQEMERNYWKMRQTESRYRLLFQIATDAVLVIDPATLRITDANEASARLFGMTTDQLVGKFPAVGMEQEFSTLIEGLLSTALAGGHSAEIRVRLAKGGHAARVSATPYSSHGPTVLLLRTRLVADRLSSSVDESRLAALVERTQDAIVVTDQDGIVMTANPAFTKLLEAGADYQAIGRPLSGWLGTAEGSVPVTINALVQNGVAPMFVAAFRTENGRVLQVELSATLLPAVDDSCFGFIMRPKNTYSVDASRGALDAALPRNIH